jgi:phenylalanyl-tRNA synthetase beta chain
LARVIRGVKVGPSPAWLRRRLETLGITPISNLVDVTNYVMMECSQPLHAFDYQKIRGQQIIVRSAAAGEKFEAIDHHTYELQPGMCVIADAQRPVAIGGVMGGADSEVSGSTRDVLVEAADFAPLAIRTTARALRLHSPSSYRFERGVDPDGTDWASRRACQLIVELAGGELADGAVDMRVESPARRDPIVLRFSQLPRVLGIEVPAVRVLEILRDLGLETVAEDAQRATLVSPSWRRDLTREIDLIEEVARIHGYDAIPEDVGVPMVPSQRQPQHRVLAMVRGVLTARGFSEALTVSVVDERLSDCFSPWTDAPPIRASAPILRGADCLRRSLVPSLLEARRVNESLANDPIELFETAKVYLSTRHGLPDEPWMLAMTSGEEFRTVKGVIETMLESLHVHEPLSIEPLESDFLEPQQSGWMLLGAERLGLIGPVNPPARKQLGLRRPTVIAELRLGMLVELSQLVPQYQPLSPYPAIQYDFNFVVDERIQWAQLEATVRQAGGEVLEAVKYQETYRDEERDGAGRKRLLLSVRLRSNERTLTGQEAEQVREAIIGACQRELQARLL